MPVKAFSSDDLYDLEKQINEWKKGQTYTIKSVSLATSASDTQEMFYAIVVFSTPSEVFR